MTGLRWGKYLWIAPLVAPLLLPETPAAIKRDFNRDFQDLPTEARHFVDVLPERRQPGDAIRATAKHKSVGESDDGNHIKPINFGKNSPDTDEGKQPQPGSGWSLSSFLGGMFIGMILSLTAVAGLLPKEKSLRNPCLRRNEEKDEANFEAGSADGTPCAASADVSPTSAPFGEALQSPTVSPSIAESRWKAPETLRAEECSLESLHLFWPRLGCLVLMLMIQSISSLILNGFENLITNHPSLVYFLTMLVGLGGNAGGQSVVLSVRRIALGDPVYVSEQLLVGLKMSLVLCPLAFLRAIVQKTSWPMAIVIAASALVITIVATTFGTAMPKILLAIKMDPAHAACIIQVLMDIGGIAVVCLFGLMISGMHLNGE